MLLEDWKSVFIVVTIAVIEGDEHRIVGQLDFSVKRVENGYDFEVVRQTYLK